MHPCHHLTSPQLHRHEQLNSDPEIKSGILMAPSPAIMNPLNQIDQITLGNQGAK